MFGLIREGTIWEGDFREAPTANHGLPYLQYFSRTQTVKGYELFVLINSGYTLLPHGSTAFFRVDRAGDTNVPALLVCTTS